MLKRFCKKLLSFGRITAACSALALVSVHSAPTPASAQQLAAQTGEALGINVIERAQKLSMRDSYSRALYLYLRTNPAVFDDSEFYVNFLIYLMTTTPGFDCSAAFTNEFERRDYFTQSFSIKEQLRNVVASVQIPQRFDIAYSIDTGRYDFTSGNLPFSNIRSIGLRETLASSIRAGNGAESCAGQILIGTTVKTKRFPWSFQVINAAGESRTPGFPFGDSLQLNTNDARQLFERFGRQLYAIVGYQFQSANNGDRKIQIIPTDGQLFGLSSDAVVRVKSYSHPTLSQPQYLDIQNPLLIKVPQFNIDMDITFKQQGFRAVGKGLRRDPGTDITTGGIFEVGGSAAVGSSVFIMRLATPQLKVDLRNLPDVPSAQRYVTLFGGLEIEQATPNSAPVSGLAIMLQYNATSGELQQSQPVNFSGEFRPAEVAAAQAEAPAAEQSQLDVSPVTPTAPAAAVEN